MHLQIVNIHGKKVIKLKKKKKKIILTRKEVINVVMYW